MQAVLVWLVPPIGKEMVVLESKLLFLSVASELTLFWPCAEAGGVKPILLR